MRLAQRYRNFVLDCDGVLWHSNTAIDGAVQAIKRLREQGRVIFVTNNATKTRAQYLDKFARLGFEGVQLEDINTSASAAAELCRRDGLNKVFVIGEAGAVEECRSAGLDVVVDEGGDAMGDEEFAGYRTDPAVKGVVVGWDRHFCYRKLAIASLYLQAGARLIATNPDPADKVGGRFMPGNGCSVAAIQYSVGDPLGARTTIAGKPNEALMASLLAKYGLNARETIMVGDRLDTDIAFAGSVVDSLLVLSGCTSREEAAASSLPTYVAEDLAAALDMDVPPAASEAASEAAQQPEQAARA